MGTCRTSVGGVCQHLETVEHGNYSTYTNHGCRCDLCYEVNRAYKRKRYLQTSTAERRRLRTIRCKRTGGPCTHDVEHGNYSTYSNHGCRCEPCRVAWNAYLKELRVRRSMRLTRGLVEVEHGTLRAYSHYQCRCRECRRFVSAYRQSKRAQGGG